MKHIKPACRHTAVITGASSGIGMEFARVFAGQGYCLVVCARREERLKKLKEKLESGYGICCETAKADLSSEAECHRFFDAYVKDKKVDVFINNAGFGECGRFAETDLSKEVDMIHVNVRAMHIFTKRILKQFREQGRGYLLNVASSAGLFPAGPYMAAYYATKAYVVSLTKAAAWELAEEGSRIYVGALCPGPVNTEFNHTANVQFSLPGISAGSCVRAAMHGMARRKMVIVPSVTMKICSAGRRFLPDGILLPILSHQQKRKIR